MSSIFLILQFVLAGILTILVLLQKSASLGLGAYSGSNESLFGAKGPAGFLAKMTFIVGVLFVANTVTLGYFYNQTLRNSVVNTKTFDEKQRSVPLSPAVPSVPNEANATQNGTTKTPVAPTAPTVPTVPATPATPATPAK